MDSISSLKTKDLETSLRIRIMDRIRERFFVRFHMSLIISMSIASGLLITKGLLEAGVISMLIRYPVAVFGAYVIFFTGVRIWLWYVAHPASKTSWSTDIPTFINIPDPSISSGAAQTAMNFGGGKSGGAGASASIDLLPTSSTRGFAAQSVNISPSYEPPKSGGTSVDLPDIGDGVVLVIVCIIVVAILAVVLGAGAYLIYQAPSILPDAAFQFLLAGGLLKSKRKADPAAWYESILKATWMPFTMTLVLTVVLAGVVHHYLPQMTTLTDVFRHFGLLG